MKKLFLILMLLFSLVCFSQEKPITTFTPTKTTFYFSPTKIVVKFYDTTPEIEYCVMHKVRENNVDMYFIENVDMVILKGVLNDNKNGFIQIQTPDKVQTLLYKLN